MDRLTPNQAAKVRDALGPATGYLWELVDRLVKVGRPPEPAAALGIAPSTADRHWACAGPGRTPT
jgi:hypothetical protein